MKKNANVAGKGLISVYFLQIVHFRQHFFFYMGQKKKKCVNANAEFSGLATMCFVRRNVRMFEQVLLVYQMEGNWE